MLASARDLARAGHGILRGDLLSPRSRNLMTRFAPTDEASPPEYGLGLARLERSGVELWAHHGDITGFHAELVHVPERAVTIAALTNHQSLRPGQEALADELMLEVEQHLASR
jgi:hypothetical protein